MTSSNGASPAALPLFQDRDDYMSGSTNLTASTGSLPSSRAQASQIAKTYRQAANLFLTRRLPEALSTIEPIVTPQPVDVDTEDGASQRLVVPIAMASKGTRVKVWSFYLTFLNSVVELGPEDGKHAFGSTRWKALVAKVRDGTIWEDVVQHGYDGIEGNVDADVVINLYSLPQPHPIDRAKLTRASTAQPSSSPTPHLNASTKPVSKPTSPPSPILHST